MTISKKCMLAVVGSAALLSACATDPYYDNAYGPGYPGYEYGYDGPGYYAGPAVGFGLTFGDGFGDDRRGPRRDWGDRRDGGRHDGRGGDGHDHDHRGDDGGRG
ncbi:MAG: hypothetical protein ACXWG1_05125 [Usitatibacter sp.]